MTPTISPRAREHAERMERRARASATPRPLDGEATLTRVPDPEIAPPVVADDADASAQEQSP